MTQDRAVTAGGQVPPAGLAAGQHTTLVVGYLDQDTSATALLAAAELAHRLQATLHVVQAVQLDVTAAAAAAAGAVMAAPDPTIDQDQIRVAGETARLRVATLLQGSPATWTWTTAQGQPAEVLVQHADRVGAYLIVVGLREHSLGAFVEHLLAGSTVTRLRGTTTRPLLLVPAAAPATQH